MDEVVEILFFGGIVLLILLGPWILLWRSSLRRRRDRKEDQDRWADLTNRLYNLEQTIERIQRPPAATGAAPLQADRPVPAPSTEKSPPPLPPKEKIALDWVKPAPQVPDETPAPQPAPPPQPLPAPQFASEPVGPSLFDRLTSPGELLEETLGTNWLNKVGIVFLVIGVALLLAYQLKELGPAGKVLLGYVVSAALLGLGLWLERKERYRILARAGIGGGWGLLFFTTYAMFYVPAAHVLSSQALDLALMLLVAAAMVWHSLRYRSQVVTGLAFLLGFFTVSVSQVSVYSLSAGAVLAAGLVVIVLWMQWYELEVFGILASYLNHYLWLRPIIEPMRGHHKPFPEFPASAAMLALYWLIFRVSYVFRRPPSPEKERVSTLAALLNTVLMLALFKYQSAHPEWAFWALLTVGALETGFGQLPATRRRRPAVVVLTTIGVVLLIAAFPFRYSGARLSVLWLLEAEALLLIGVWTREVVFRRMGLLASAVVAGQMISYDAARVAGIRMDGADLSRDLKLALVFAVASLVFYANSLWLVRRWADQFAGAIDRLVTERLSYLGGLMLFVAAWLAFPEAWTAVAWAALALALAVLAWRRRIGDLSNQATAFAAATVVRALVNNLDATARFHGLTLRLITLSLVAICLYAAARWRSTEDRESAFTPADGLFAWSTAAEAYTWAASMLLSLMAWYELRPVGVAVAWGMGGLVLLEVGILRRSASLRAQAYLAFLAAFLRIFIVNLNANGAPGEISPRFYTVVPLALAFFYAYFRLRQAEGLLARLERKLKATDLSCYLGTISFAALMRFQLPADWVAAAWAALTFALFALAWRTGQRLFLHQGLLIAFAVLFRTVLHNFYERSYFPAPTWEGRWFSVGATVALLLVALPIAFRLRLKDEASPSSAVARLLQSLSQRPEQVLFFISVTLLTVLLALEMRHGMVTVAWGVEGVAVFLLALWLAERSFRLTGLGLLLLCVGKILLVDVWRLNPRDRYLTFIVMGAALLLVSFLYTRNREALRQYL